MHPILSSSFLRLRLMLVAALAVFWLCLLWAWPAQAQLQLQLGGRAVAADTVTTPHVQAQLVLQAPHGVQPGQPLQLGLRITHQPHWHTYWKNAGDSGLATQLDWQLPEGLQAGEIQWPLPQAIRVGDLLNYGYEDTVLLPVPLTVTDHFQPDAQGMLDVRLFATWLVCRVECIPEEGQFHLRVPAEVAHTMWQDEFAQALAQTPIELPSATAQLQADAQSDTVQLRVQGLPASAQGQVLDFFPELANTFRHAAVLGQDWQQAWEGETWTAQFPLSDLREAAPSALALVLTPAQRGDDPTVAWRITAHITQPWTAAEQATMSPALIAALEANARTASTTPVTTANSTSSWWMAVIGGVLGGLLLNLMPCVFPVLAIKLMGLTRHNDQPRVQRLHGLVYAAGVVLSFLALGALLLALRAAGEQLGWGFQLQSPWMVAALAALFTLIGLNLAGVFEMGQIVPSQLASLHARHPAVDALLSGILAVAIASPCTAPFMGASLGFAVSMPALQALAVFAALGVGMALPYVLVSWVPRLVQWLPRPGAWMDIFRRAMAFPMFATVIWLIWVLGQQTGIDGAAVLLGLLLCLSALVWTLSLTGRTRWGLSLLVLVLTAWLLHASGRSTWEATPAAPTSANSLWQPWSPETQAQLLAQGRPVFVDYTAAWCVTCQYNKRTTLSDAAVLADFAQRGVTLLRADWTRRDPAITQALAELGRNGVPVYVLLAPGQPPIVMTELLSKQEVHQALQQL